MDRNIIGQYFRTIKYLKFIQVYYRLFYFIRNKIYDKKYTSVNTSTDSKVFWNNTIYYNKSYLGNNTFHFLNQNKKFDTIDWNFNKYGKLWNYNLVYFDFLNQKELDKNESLYLINNFIDNKNSHIIGHEPYTISLRNVNWIKFLLINDINNQKINDYIYISYLRLLDNLEFHLLGNHLLENAFSLLFGAYYFNDKNLYQKSEEILLNQLDIQILNDGAHFELSPMYHSIILQRVLDSIYLIKHNNGLASNKLIKKLNNKAILMLSWLKTIKYKNNSIPHFNDSTNGIAAMPVDLFRYAELLGLEWSKIELKESGYRKYLNKDIECIVDMGLIGPDYLPGHGHSDIFNFELYYKSIPFIVDTGISTYENNKKRYIERSTQSHNTIMIDDINQSEVWSSFRVGRRAKIINFIEEENMFIGYHDGYKNLNLVHSRKFIFEDTLICIEDSVNGINKLKVRSFLHFHPDRNIKILNNTIFIDEKIELKFHNYLNIKIENYDYCIGFNDTVIGKKMVGFVNNESKIEVIIKK